MRPNAGLGCAVGSKAGGRHALCARAAAAKMLTAWRWASPYVRPKEFWALLCCACRFLIDRRKYHPAPKVDGAVVDFRLLRPDDRPAVPNERTFLQLVRWHLVDCWLQPAGWLVVGCACTSGQDGWKLMPLCMPSIPVEQKTYIPLAATLLHLIHRSRRRSASGAR